MKPMTGGYRDASTIQGILTSRARWRGGGEKGSPTQPEISVRHDLPITAPHSSALQAYSSKRCMYHRCLAPWRATLVPRIAFGRTNTDDRQTFVTRQHRRTLPSRAGGCTSGMRTAVAAPTFLVQGSATTLRLRVVIAADSGRAGSLDEASWRWSRGRNPENGREFKGG